MGRDAGAVLFYGVVFTDNKWNDEVLSEFLTGSLGFDCCTYEDGHKLCEEDLMGIMDKHCGCDFENTGLLIAYKENFGMITECLMSTCFIQDYSSGDPITLEDLPQWEPEGADEEITVLLKKIGYPPDDMKIGWHILPYFCE